MNNRELGKKQLSGETKYHFCPHCIEELGKEGKDYKEVLKPLWEHTYEEAGTGAIYRLYSCSRCQMSNIDDNTFVRYYCCRDDGTKYTEPPKDDRHRECYELYHDFLRKRIVQENV